ncbi:MAG: 50S ribosomal protein L13 [bacterium]
MKTTTPFPSAKDIKQKWYIIDAAGKNLGRLATQVATILMGKNAPDFVPHMDNGGYVIVTNAALLDIDMKKQLEKKHQTHSGYPGGFKEATVQQTLQKKPEKLVELAVKNMLPKNRLGRAYFTKLKVYKDDQHKHEAQKPIHLS